jgi:hypothetical protein
MAQWFSKCMLWTRMSRLLTGAAAIFLIGIAGCKTKSPGKLETKTITFAKHHISSVTRIRRIRCRTQQGLVLTARKHSRITVLPATAWMAKTPAFRLSIIFRHPSLRSHRPTCRVIPMVS